MAAADTDTPSGAGAELDQPVDPRAVDVWRWTTALSFVPPFAISSIVVISASVARPRVAIAFWVAWLLLLALMGVVVWRYPPARHRHLRYRLDAAGITIGDGVFWRTRSALQRLRIQHTDVSQGPLERRYGVATLKLYTAGSRFTRIELPGLEHSVAIALGERLQRHGSDDAV